MFWSSLENWAPSHFFHLLNKSTTPTFVIQALGSQEVARLSRISRISPDLHRDVLYLVKDGGILTSLDPKTGDVHKQARLPGALGRYWASPVAADGKVYVASEEGKVSVLAASANWAVLSTNDLADEVFATAAIEAGRIYFRTRSALYCFGSPL